MRNKSLPSDQQDKRKSAYKRRCYQMSNRNGSKKFFCKNISPHHRIGIYISAHNRKCCGTDVGKSRIAHCRVPVSGCEHRNNVRKIWRKCHTDERKKNTDCKKNDDSSPCENEGLTAVCTFQMQKRCPYLTSFVQRSRTVLRSAEAF